MSTYSFFGPTNYYDRPLMFSFKIKLGGPLAFGGRRHLARFPLAKTLLVCLIFELPPNNFPYEHYNPLNISRYHCQKEPL